LLIINFLLLPEGKILIQLLLQPVIRTLVQKGGYPYEKNTDYHNAAGYSQAKRMRNEANILFQTVRLLRTLQLRQQVKSA
jgi:hypothetical protein